MKEISRIIEKYELLKSTSAKLALATVIEVSGSSYRRTGARMLIQDNGEYTGGISGGCIEGNALKKAQLVMFSGEATRVIYDTSQDDAAQIGVSLGCNGVITVMIAPIDTNDQHNPIEQLKSCRDAREANILITVIEADNQFNIAPGQAYVYSSAAELENILGDGYQHSLDEDVNKVLTNGKSVINSYPGYKLFLEFVPPTIQIIIMGGNYDVYPLLKVTNNMGWRRVVVANPKRLDHNIRQLANHVVTDFNDLIIDEYTVAIIMSHDYNTDLSNLQQALTTNLQYIGLLGPASRKKEMLVELSTTFEDDDETRIFGPAGLDIGAAQPEEIAVSIVAEILAVTRQRPGTSLRDRRGPIYSRGTK